MIGSLLRNVCHIGSKSIKCSTQFLNPLLNPTAAGRVTIGYLVADMYQRPIFTSASLFAEPLKKKKKMDPAVIRAREERKRKKLEKHIRRLEKHQRQYKPLDELEIPIAILDQQKLRVRKLPQLPKEVADARWKLVKEWGNYKREQSEREMEFFHQIRKSQDKALAELRMESQTLYEAAITLDRDFIPYEVKGPTDTPPIENYTYPDGDYVDVSRKWE